jgi:hypothetical protein
MRLLYVIGNRLNNRRAIPVLRMTVRFEKLLFRPYGTSPILLPCPT